MGRRQTDSWHRRLNAGRAIPRCRTISDVTAKEALRELIDDMADDEAEWTLGWLAAEQAQSPRPLTPDESAAIERGLADSAAGRLVDLEEVERELGLAD